MKEADRIQLYNDLCDYEQELKAIYYPPKTMEADMIHRAILFVRGETGRWVLAEASPVFDGHERIIGYTGCKCDKCGFSDGKSTFKFCPSCGARMR